MIDKSDTKIWMAMYFGDVFDNLLIVNKSDYYFGNKHRKAWSRFIKRWCNDS